MHVEDSSFPFFLGKEKKEKKGLQSDCVLRVSMFLFC